MPVGAMKTCAGLSLCFTQVNSSATAAGHSSGAYCQRAKGLGQETISETLRLLCHRFTREIMPSTPSAKAKSTVRKTRCTIVVVVMRTYYSQETREVNGLGILFGH